MALDEAAGTNGSLLSLPNNGSLGSRRCPQQLPFEDEKFSTHKEAAAPGTFWSH